MTLLTLPILAAILAQPEPEPVVAPIEPISRVLVDQSLTQRSVRLLSIDAQSVRVIDEQGRTQSVPRSEVLAILPALTLLDPPFVPEPVRRSSRPTVTISGTQPASQPLNPPALGRLELTDGQILPGTISSAVTKDAVSWNSKLWGSVTVPLENAAAIVITPDRFDALLAGARGTQDLVLLGNGDRVEGFLEYIDASVVRLERTGKASELALSRVDGVLLANPIKPAGGAWAWVSGAAAAITNVSLTDTGTFVIAGRLPGSKTQPSATLPAETVDAVCFDAAALKSLASLPFDLAPSDQGRWSQPPIITTPTAPLGASDIELPGPMRVEWTLPRGVTRFATTLELPPSARLWGDCEVVVEAVNSGGVATILAKAPLNQSTPQAVVNSPLNGAAKVRITVNPGPSGPIQDRVVIRRALLLIKP